MPKALMEKMKRGGVRNPYALLNAAGYEEGDSEAEAKRKLRSHAKAHSRLQKARRKRP